MKLMKLDDRKFKQISDSLTGRSKGEPFQNRCILVLRWIRSIQKQYFSYWNDDTELCDKYMMKSKKDGQFPFIRSEKIKKLVNDTRLNHLIEMGLVKQCKLDPIWVKHSHRCSRYSAYYYTLTNEALSLFDGTWTGISKADAKYIRSSIKSQLSPFYKRIGRQLDKFSIQLSNDEYYMSQFRKHVHKKHQGKPITDEQCEEMTEEMYDSCEDYSYLDQSLLEFTWSSCSETWSGRFYSPYTQMSSYLRNFIVWNEHPEAPLIQLDFQTFQMHTLVYAMKKHFGIQDLGKFEDDLINGVDVYQVLTNLYYNEEDADRTKRDNLKTKIFQLIYSKINEFDRFWIILKKVYPEFAEALVRAKTEPIELFKAKMVIRKEDPYSNCYKQAPFLGSYYEVKLFERIWRHLLKKKVGIPFISIHDALLVPEYYADYVEEFMKERSTKLFGYDVPIDRKELSQKAICCDDSIDESYSITENSSSESITTSTTSTGGSKGDNSDLYLSKSTVILKETERFAGGKCNKHQCFQWFYSINSNTSTVSQQYRLNRTKFSRMKSFIFAVRE